MSRATNDRKDDASGAPASFSARLEQPNESEGVERARLTAQPWCTGEDSNLRTSLGGTDLQSVGFNHSPTCAQTFGRCSCTQLDLHKSAFAKAGKPRIARKDCAKITTRRKTSDWSALEKPVAPLPSPPPNGKFVSSCRFLELAKGFEPPTL